MTVNRKSVLTVKNHHAPDCGEPPDLETDGELRTAYLETAEGKQWVIRLDPQRREGVLYGGGGGWQYSIPIHEGRIDRDFILSTLVGRLLMDFWEEVTGTPLPENPVEYFVQEILDDDPYVRHTVELAKADMRAAEYVRCGAIQGSMCKLAKAVDSLEDHTEEAEVVLRRTDVDAIATALEACLLRAGVRTY